MISFSAGKVQLKLDHATIRQSATKTSWQSAQRAATISRDRARAAARRKDLINTGKGIQSITFERIGPPGLITTYHVRPTAWYMRIQEVGTGPIYPVRAQFLRFKPKGKNYFVFARRTRGVPAGRFMREARNAITQADFLPLSGDRLG